MLQDLDQTLVKLMSLRIRSLMERICQTLIKRLGNLLRFADAAALDDDVVKLLQLRKTHEFFEQVASKGTADAAVLESDDLFVCPRQTVRLLDEGGIDVDTLHWAGRQ